MCQGQLAYMAICFCIPQRLIFPKAVKRQTSGDHCGHGRGSVRVGSSVSAVAFFCVLNFAILAFGVLGAELEFLKFGL